jgi:FkbM family methyltransferase
MSQIMSIASEYHEYLNSLHRKLGKSIFVAQLAILVRNQCKQIIRYCLNEGIEQGSNGEEWLAKTIAPSTAVVIDVGANLGNWAKMYIEYMQAVNKVLLFEPSNNAASKLRDLFDCDIHVDVVQAAVSDCVTEMTFFEEPDAGETSSLIGSFSNDKAVSSIVKVTTIDEEMRTRGIEKVDFLKIDAEGYDLHVLRGAKKSISEHRIDAIQFEYNAPWQLVGSSLVDAYELLNSSGYKVFLLKESGLFDIGTSGIEDYFFYSNFVAITPKKMEQLGIQVQSAKLFPL